MSYRSAPPPSPPPFVLCSVPTLPPPSTSRGAPTWQFHSSKDGSILFDQGVTSTNSVSNLIWQEAVRSHSDTQGKWESRISKYHPGPTEPGQSSGSTTWPVQRVGGNVMYTTDKARLAALGPKKKKQMPFRQMKRRARGEAPTAVLPFHCFYFWNMA